MRKTLLLSLLSLLGVAGASEAMAQGGPDAYGYTWITSTDVGGPAYNWVDITTKAGAVQVAGLSDDNAVGQFNIGWDFHYYWTDVSQVKIGSNGWVGFNNIGNIASCFPTVPTAGGAGDHFLAPFMSDLIFGSGGGNQGEVWYWSNNADSFIVSYINAPWWRSTAPGYAGDNTFQIILNGGDSSIVFQYGSLTPNDFNNNSQCAADLEIGIENITGNIGLECYNETVPASNFVIKFVYPAVVTFQVPDATPSWNANSDNAGQFYIVGTALDMITNVSNVGNADISNNITVNGNLQTLALNNVWTSSTTLNGLVTGTNNTVTFPQQALLTNPGQYYYNVSLTNSQDINPSNNNNTVEVSAVECASDSMILTYATGNPPDGSISWNGGNVDDGVGIHIVPPQYPVTISSVDYFIVDWDGSGTSNPTTGFQAQLVAEDGNGNPGTVITSTNVAVGDVVENDWNRVTFPVSHTVSSGGVYVAWYMGGDSIAIGTEAFGPISRRSWEILSGSWAPFREGTSQEFLIRVNVETICVVANDKPVDSRLVLNAYPNPASGLATVAFETPAAGDVTFRMVNALGQEVMLRNLSNLGAGMYNFPLQTRELPAGVYFLHLESNGAQAVHKLVIE